MSDTIRDTDLAGVAAELRAAREDVLYTLAIAAGYVDMKALQGCPSAAHIATLIKSAEDRMKMAAMAAVTAQKEHAR